MYVVCVCPCVVCVSCRVRQRYADSSHSSGVINQLLQRLEQLAEEQPPLPPLSAPEPSSFSWHVSHVVYKGLLWLVYELVCASLTCLAACVPQLLRPKPAANLPHRPRMSSPH